LLATGLAGAQTYPIHLSRKTHPGQTYTFSASGSQRRQMSNGGVTVQADEFEVNFQGTATVLETDTSGEAYKVSFTVKKFTRINGDSSVDLVPAGQTITVDGSQKQSYRVAGHSLNKAAHDAFNVVYSAHKPNSVSDDQVFGTNEQRSVGDKWPLNKSLAAQSAAADAGISLSPEQLSGSVQFLAVDQIAGSDCAKVQGEMSAEGFSAKDADSGMYINPGSMKAEFRGCFPFDESAQSFRSGTTLQLHLRAISANGQEVEITGESKSDGEWIALRQIP